MRVRTCMVIVSIAVLAAGCGSSEGSGTGPSTSTVPDAPRTSTVPATSRSAPAGVVPAELVGAWSRSEGTAEVAYRFLADGRYRSIEILSQPRPRGIFEFRWQQDGTATVSGDRLRLRPTTSVTSRTDPDDPSGDYADRPSAGEERTFTWLTSGATLVLTGEDGVPTELERQP